MLTREITKIVYDIYITNGNLELRIEKVKDHYDVRFKCEQYQHFVYTNLNLGQVNQIKDFLEFIEKLKQNIVEY